MFELFEALFCNGITLTWSRPMPTPMKKRRSNESPMRIPVSDPVQAAVGATAATAAAVPVPVLSIEQQYKLYQKELTEFYNANKKKYMTPIYEKLVTCGIFSRDNTVKDVPWQLVKMKAKEEFDKAKKERQTM